MRVLVIGGGISGLGAARILKSRGSKVILYDDKLSQESLPNDLRGDSLILTKDKNFLGSCTDLSQIVVSPGFPTNHPLWDQLRKFTDEHPSQVISELDLGLQFYKGEIFAVTGTNGKSTTTAMIQHLLKESGIKASIGGNFGVSVCELLANNNLESCLALEASSYQLEQSRPQNYRTAVFTNFTPDHLARHKTLENYFLAKWKIFSSNHKFFKGYISEEVFQYSKKFAVTISPNIEVLKPSHQLILTLKEAANIDAQTNIQNAMFALFSVGDFLKKDPLCLAGLLKNFSALPHRFETIKTLSDGRRIINDSKATNVASTLAALSNVSKPCVLFLGGLPKEERFHEIRSYASKISHIFTFGKAAPLIYEDLIGLCPIQKFETLADLISFLGAHPSTRNDLGWDFLFSPACASQDEFKNFEERGCFFSSKISALF